MFFYVSLASPVDGLQFFIPKKDEKSAVKMFAKMRKSKQARGSVLLVQVVDGPSDVQVDEYGHIVKAPGAVARTFKEKVFVGGDDE